MRHEPEFDDGSVPDYGTPGGIAHRGNRPVADAPRQAADTDLASEEGGFANFVDELEVRARGLLSDLGIGPDDDLPTVSDGVDWALYPGVHLGDADRALGQPSQEDTIRGNDELLRELREAITPQFGLSWGVFGEIPRVEPERNDWGGRSLLETTSTGVWRSTAKLTNPLVKRQLVDLVSRMLVGAGFADVTLRNDPARASGARSPVETERHLAALEREFGGRTLRDQVIWSLVARRIDADTRFELTIIDLRHDHTGVFLEAARQRAELRGGPMNSVDLEIVSRGTLPQELEDEFRERAARFERRDPPAS